jgi:hypothetical protein
MRHRGLTRTVVGGASAAVALGTNIVAADATTLPAVHFSYIVAVKKPPTGEIYPFGNSTAVIAVGKTSAKIAAYAIPKLIAEAMRAQSASIHAISGATYTSRAFKNSLVSAVIKLGQSRTTTTVYGRTYSVTIPIGCAGTCPSPLPRYGVVEVKVTGHRR